MKLLTYVNAVVGRKRTLVTESRVFEEVAIQFCVLHVVARLERFDVRTTKLVGNQASTVKLKNEEIFFNENLSH
jgi:hypothetical protein